MLAREKRQNEELAERLRVVAANRGNIGDVDSPRDQLQYDLIRAFRS